jgi:hypothetical protein
MRRAAFALGLLLLPGLGGPVLADSYPVGIWFGEGEPEDSHEMWLEWFTADGGFRGLYRLCDKGKGRDMVQAGRWSIDGDDETIQIATVDGLPAPRIDLYKRMSYDGKKWVYRYLGNGYVFTARRVDDKFQMPSCESIS